MDDDEEDPFAKAEAEERDFRASRGGMAANETNRDAFGGATAEAPLSSLRDGFLSGSGSGLSGGSLREPPREASFAMQGHAGYGAGGASREPISNGFATNPREGDISMPPPRGAFATSDFARGGASGPPGAFGRRDASPAHSAHASVHRAFADVSLDRSREGPRAPPLPPGAPPGAPRRPGPAAPEEAERDVERDAFQAELERVVAEQEAERRRRENPGNAMHANNANANASDADAEKTGAPFAAGRSGGAPLAGADGAPAEWRRTARELAGSALVSHPPPPPGPPPGAHLRAPYEASSASGIAEDAETLKERKKRGGRRVREAEERRAAKASENASSSSSSAPGGTHSMHTHHPEMFSAHHGSDPGGAASSVPGHGTGLGLEMGQGGAPPGPPAAGGWGAGALGGLAWAGPIAEIQRSASSDALAHAARARMASDPGAPGRADAAAAMSSAAAAAAAAAAHHHQAAAASNAFAYESAIAALGALVDRRPVGGASGSVDDRASGGHPSSQHHTRNPGGVSVPRPAFGQAPGAGSVGAPIGGPIGGPIGSVGLGFGGGMWSAAGPPLPPGPPPPGPPPPRGGAQGGAASSPGGAAATLVAAAALEDD